MTRTRLVTIIIAAVCCTAALIMFIVQATRIHDPWEDIPKPKMPSPNAFDYYTRAGKMLVNIKAINEVRRSLKNPLDNYTGKVAILKPNVKALSMLRKGFAYEYLQPPSRSYKDDFSYYSQYRSLACLLIAEAQVKEKQGDWNGALSSCLDAIKFGVDTPHGAQLIGVLVGLTSQAIPRPECWHIYQHLTTNQLKCALQRLNAILANQITYAEVLTEDKWCQKASLLDIIDHPERYTAPGTTPGFSGLSVSDRKQLVQDDVRMMNTLISDAKKPFTKARTERPIFSTPISNALLTPLFTTLNRARIKWLANIAKYSMLETTLALHVYKLEHGCYPNDLSALAPGYLPKVPDDPFAKQGSLRYMSKGNTFLLYSIGPDCTDDVGKSIEDISKTGFARYVIEDNSKGDIVAGVNN